MPSTFDIVIVGAGASGGWAAKRLAEAGLRVALVDAGRPHTDADFREHTPSFDLRYRGMAAEIVRRTRPRQSECYACTEHNVDWFANDLDEPYTTPATIDDPAILDEVGDALRTIGYAEAPVSA